MLESMLAGLANAAGGAAEQRGECVHALLEIVKHAVFFCSPTHEPFVFFIEHDRRRVLSLRGPAFGRLLARWYHLNNGQPAPLNALQQALALLMARAQEERDPLPVFNRFGLGAEALWLDLADPAGRAVRVTRQGWEVVEHPAVLFLRYAHQQPLPEPQAGGELASLRALFPLEHAGDWLLVRAWMLAAMNPLIPAPMLCLIGPPGSGKTTAARLIRRLLDPSLAESFSLQSEERMAATLDQHALPVFDNLGRLRSSQSNLFCRAVSGTSLIARRYHEREELIFRYRRAMILTSLELPSTAPDWRQRALVVRFRALAPEERQSELMLWGDVQQRLPRWLGALLKLQSGAFAAFGAKTLPALPRMADFAAWGAAASAADGQPAAAFLDAFAANQERLDEELLDADPLAVALQALLRGRVAPWCGPVQQLLAELRPLDATGALKKLSPDMLGRRLRNLQAMFQPRLKIQFDRAPGSGQRQVLLEPPPPQALNASSVSI